MKPRHLLSRVILPLAMLALVAGILSCATPVETGPRAWIDWPLDGYEVEVGTTVTVMSHAYAQEGVAEAQLAVDMKPVRLAQPTQAGEQFVEISLDWVANEPGVYLLSVTAFDTTGEASNPTNVTVRVLGEAPTPALTPTEVATPMPPEETPLRPTATTLPPSATPVPATATPAPPVIVSFAASPGTMMAGECSRLTWAVEGLISAVYLDGEGVGDHDSRDRCPDATTSYTLRAQGPGGEVTESLAVEVMQPSPTPDTQGPPAPSAVSPTGNDEVGCGAVTLRWTPVTDPSGIGDYYIKVEKVTGTFKSGAWTTTGTQFTIPVAWIECGHSYRWAVRTEDGAGNFGPWSDWAEFTVTIT